MSNPIRFDPPLVRALAAELSARLSGRMAHAVPVFDADRSALLLLDRGEALRWDLHPTRGWVCIVPRPPALADREADARIGKVGAPPDERLLHLEMHEGGRFRGGRRMLVVELHTNQWNALLVDTRDSRIVSALRARDAGGRSLRPGAVYAPPAPMARVSARDEAVARRAWASILAPLPPPERRTALLRHFAGTSPVNADALLGDALRDNGDAALDAAFGRWLSLASARETQPGILRLPNGMQPYPAPLDGVPWEPAESLLTAMETVAAAISEESPTARPAALEWLPPARRRRDAAIRRVERLRSEEAVVGEAERLRAQADLLTAHLHAIPAGAASVVLPGFEGGEETIALDPARRPHENAARLYDEARSRQRAEERLPTLVARAEQEAARWTEGVAALESGGEPPSWMEGALRRPETTTRRPTPGERVPYRLYRTSGGLEVRVGRSSKDNDGLTFGHSDREDIWLHARQVPGSHVVLRWTAPETPPARDLEEAAVLAAWYSKARTSGTVAVDWTRRKHVRKPRGAPPGRVAVLRAKTVFVAPDPAVEARLRADPDASDGA